MLLVYMPGSELITLPLVLDLATFTMKWQKEMD